MSKAKQGYDEMIIAYNRLKLSLLLEVVSSYMVALIATGHKTCLASLVRKRTKRIKLYKIIWEEESPSLGTIY